MRIHTTITAVGLATAGILAGAAAPTTAADRAPAPEAVAIAEDTGECLGLTDRQSMNRLPDLTTLIALGLPRLGHDEGRQCLEKAAAGRDNPIVDLLDGLTSAAPGLGKPASRPDQAARADDEDASTGLLGDVLNKLCVGTPVKVNIPQLIGLINIVAVQDTPILSAPKSQQCANNSPQAKGDK